MKRDLDDAHDAYLRANEEDRQLLLRKYKEALKTFADGVFIT
jgi:hypothetical protein